MKRRLEKGIQESRSLRVNVSLSVTIQAVITDQTYSTSHFQFNLLIAVD
jgi:hypothetical protein